MKNCDSAAQSGLSAKPYSPISETCDTLGSARLTRDAIDEGHVALNRLSEIIP